MKFLAVDPGDETGWSVWEDGKLIEACTTEMRYFARMVWHAQENPDDVMHGITKIVCEDFRIYPWKAKELSWDGVYTARLIGALAVIAELKEWEFILYPAKIKERAEAAGAEQFFTFPLHENRHQNDSCRLAWYHLMVCKNPDVELKNVTGTANPAAEVGV